MKTFEYKEINYKNSSENDEQFCLKDQEFRERFKAYLKKQNLSGAIGFRDGYIKTGSYVGVVRFKNFQLDIFPKLLCKLEPGNTVEQTDDNEEESSIVSKLSADEKKLLDKKEDVEKITKNLIYMLSLTKKLDVKFTQHANINCHENPFLEVLIREYAISLFECLKRLTPRNYVREEDNLNYLKGKLKFTENIRYNCANKAKFYCEFDEFSENNELNRLFLFVAKCLFKISKNGENKKTLTLIMNYFCDLPFVKTDKYKADKIILNRNQMLFEHPFKLAKMFLNHISVDISQNSIENITLLWDMNKLFEEFVFEVLRRGCKNYSVESQKNARLLVNPDNKRKRGNTYVDIYIKKKDKNNNEKIIILDTKYKLETLKDNADIYQLSTYCLQHHTNDSVLIYPKEMKDSKTSDKEYFSTDTQYELYTLPLTEKTEQNTDKIFINRIYVDLRKDDLKGIISNVDKFERYLDNIELLHEIRPILNKKNIKSKVKDEIIEKIRNYRGEENPFDDISDIPDLKSELENIIKQEQHK